MQQSRLLILALLIHRSLLSPSCGARAGEHSRGAPSTVIVYMVCVCSISETSFDSPFAAKYQPGQQRSVFPLPKPLVAVKTQLICALSDQNEVSKLPECSNIEQIIMTERQ